MIKVKKNHFLRFKVLQCTVLFLVPGASLNVAPFCRSVYVMPLFHTDHESPESPRIDKCYDSAGFV